MLECNGHVDLSAALGVAAIPERDASRDCVLDCASHWRGGAVVGGDTSAHAMVNCTRRAEEREAGFQIFYYPNKKLIQWLLDPDLGSGIIMGMNFWFEWAVESSFVLESILMSFFRGLDFIPGN